MLLFNENAIPSGLGYTVENSLRFRSGASAYLSRTPASTGNRKTWTWSGWVKRGNSGVDHLMSCTAQSGNDGLAAIYFQDNQLYTYYDTSGPNPVGAVGPAVYRDKSAWYHIVWSVDAANTIHYVYVNGVLVSTDTGKYPPNYDYAMNRAGYVQRMGARGWDDPGVFFDGYMAEVNFIDGQALTPASFGEINASTNSWTAKKYTGTYGTNGFYLPFTDTTSTTTLVADSSGNGNNWTPNNISLTAGVTYDSMIDSPTNGISGTRSVGNYASWNPLDKGTVTVTDGNLSAVATADIHAIKGTMGLPSSGKFYWETTVSGLGYGSSLGIADGASSTTSGPSSGATRTFQWGSWFNTFNSGVVQYGTNQSITGGANWSGASQLAASDILMIAVDMDNGSMWIGKNGTWFNSSGTANPATNTDPRWTGLTGNTWFAYYASYGTSSPPSASVNFGQRPFSYTPPTGFKSLNTANLPEPTIKKSSEYMDVTTWTGTGATRSITGVGFQPDLVWTKSRSNAETHKLVDAVRGATKALSSETTGAEVTESGITSFNTDGFTIDGATDTGYNTNTYTYVGWQWKEGTTPGFDIVTYTGNGSTQNINHNLGAVPRMMIIKSRSTAQRWTVFHTNTSNAYLYLNETFAAEPTNANLRFGNNSTVVQPTSSVFTIGNSVDVNQNTTTYAAYLFAEVPGFSKFGSYTGNGSTDGPFVFCGFRPRFVLIKNTNAVAHWQIIDTARNSHNLSDLLLYPSSLAAEEGVGVTNRAIDILSNGFKLRSSDSAYNGNGNSIIFAAFAETPFKYSLAR